MKTLFVALLLVSTPLLRASVLELDFNGGWGTSYNLKVNFDTGKVIYVEKPASPAKVYQLPNHKNVGLYVKALLEKISEDHVGIFGDDVPTSQINFTDGKSVKELRIGHIFYPGAIAMNEGWTPEKELKIGKEFIESTPAWFLCNVLDVIVDLPNHSPKFQKP